MSFVTGTLCRREVGSVSAPAPPWGGSLRAPLCHYPWAEERRPPETYYRHLASITPPGKTNPSLLPMTSTKKKKKTEVGKSCQKKSPPVHNCNNSKVTEASIKRKLQYSKVTVVQKQAATADCNEGQSGTKPERHVGVAPAALFSRRHSHSSL